MDARLKRIKELFSESEKRNEELSHENFELKKRIAELELEGIDIVHCKECKHSNVDKMGWYCNKHYHRYADENTHFCSDGEVEE